MKKVLIALAVAVLAGCGGGGDESATTTNPVPNVPLPAPNPFDKFVGDWSVRYTGEDFGSCTLNVPITSSTFSARVTGSCFSTLAAIRFPVDGTLSSDGSFRSGSLIGDGLYMTGSLSGSSGSGRWTTTLGRLTASGNWTASR